MDKTLRTAATGLAAEQKYVEIIANNISNVNTTGFKKVRPEFQDLLYETLQPAGAVSQVGTEPLNEVQIGSGTKLVATTRILSQGDVTQTNNALDMAINGEGYFMIRKPDNSIAYSRDGTFHLDAQGQIVNSQGYLLEPGFTIPDDTTDIQVSRDGYLQVMLSGETQAQVLGQIELARFINPGGLRAVGDNLFVETPASGQPIYEQPGSNNTGEILQKSLENSNVDIVEEMVNMIIAQRAYELNSKSVMTADNILATAVNLKR
ncbi:MAG TPA: flagellar basal-body rod protein FlgG [Bacteroidota bacterium]|nr:flagellar basal-body rod protein FlgG [Candidatus Kapabacteria bacterium]HRS01058.1 flagellar basal-body rod protein FlgG [Bacteroidota bacterium]HRT67285.1 flagellar basal-body rod protein FlgG [Bacteroidota bacterium]